MSRRGQLVSPSLLGLILRFDKQAYVHAHTFV